MLNKYKITFINAKWETIKSNVSVNTIPRKDELVYIEEVDKYFEVINIIHKLNEKQSIFVVVSELIQKEENAK